MTSDAHDHVEPATLRQRLAEAEDMLRAIRLGEIDALVVDGPRGSQIYTLHSAEEPYRILVEEMQEGAVVLNARGDILYANASFAALTGEPLASIVGGRIDRFMSPPDRSEVQAMLSRGNGRLRTRLCRAESAGIDVSLSLTTTGASGDVQLNLIVADLTDLLEANSRRDVARRENRTKDEFLATFAHELRTPLAAIGAAAQLLEVNRAAAGIGSSRPYEVIARQVDHISRLINDLLDIERIVSGHVRLNRHPIDLESAVRQVVATFSASTASARQISLDAEPVWVDWDAVRLQQVLTNIVANAVKYTPSDGQICVTVRADGNHAVFSVEDTGFGIPSNALPFIFDMFVQVGRTLDHAQNGLGIGLALVRHLVELHEGTIVASSDGEGRGSTFTVRLTRIAAPADEAFQSGGERRRDAHAHRDQPAG